MTGLINLGAGLAAAGGAVSQWADTQATATLKKQLEVESQLLSDKLLTRRQEAEFARNHSQEALNFDINHARATTLAAQQADAEAGADPTVIKNRGIAKTADLKNTVAAQSDPDVLAAEGTITSAKARQAAAASVLPDVLAAKTKEEMTQSRARLSVENSPEAITGAANRASAEAKARLDAQRGEIDPQAMDFQADLVLAGGKPTINIRSGAQSQEFQKALARRAEAKGMKPEDVAKATQNFNAAQKTLNDYDAGVTGRQVTAMNNVIGHMDVLESLAKALDNGDVQMLNSLKNRWKEAFGSELPTNLKGAATIVGPEIMKALVPGGGGERERELAVNEFNDSISNRQVSGLIQTKKRILAGQMAGYEKRYQAGTGRDDFRTKYLLPETIEQLEASEKFNETGRASLTATPTAVAHPSSIPPNAEYSASRQQYRVPDGKGGFTLLDKDGNPLQ